MLPTKHRIKKPRVFHVKHPGKRRERGGKAVLVFFSASGGYRSCLFGNSNGKQNLLIGLLAATLSGYSGGVHNGQPPLDGVEKQPHILCAVKGKGTAAFGRAGQALDIFFRPGYGELMTNHMGGGLRACRSDKPAARRLSSTSVGSLSRRSLFATADWDLPTCRATSSWDNW